MAQGHKTLTHLRTVYQSEGKNICNNRASGCHGNTKRRALPAVQVKLRWREQQCVASDALTQKSAFYSRSTLHNMTRAQHELLHTVQSAEFGAGSHVHIWCPPHSFPSLRPVFLSCTQFSTPQCANLSKSKICKPTKISKLFKSTDNALRKA